MPCEENTDEPLFSYQQKRNTTFSIKCYSIKIIKEMTF